MVFEFDKKKNLINKQKHGIDFYEAQKLWYNNAKVLYEKTVDGEDRFSVVGYIDQKCYIGIFTFRGRNVRIISVRRCRKSEKERYIDENHC